VVMAEDTEKVSAEFPLLSAPLPSPLLLRPPLQTKSLLRRMSHNH
jgi:hypothetical protein